jgi:hypothetical protein
MRTTGGGRYNPIYDRQTTKENVGRATCRQKKYIDREKNSRVADQPINGQTLLRVERPHSRSWRSISLEVALKRVTKLGQELTVDTMLDEREGLKKYDGCIIELITSIYGGTRIILKYKLS